ncbi:hypothetical protein [Streptomyces sp. NPDC051132]|uniref:hypothetical protein n=1 Tax=unclassified Streptomyces TaxID=2593676 RepID=UPI0034463094
MSGSGEDLRTEGLELIAKGLTDALGELNELGMVGAAGAGRGFSEIALSGLELGHEGLTEEFKSFCERWEWGVRALVDEGNEFASKTGLAAGTYYETDQYIGGTFKIVTNAVIGNPYASEEEVQKESWGRIAGSGAFGGDVDYSGESFEQAWATGKEGWETAGHDVMTSHTIGPMPGVGVAGLREAAEGPDERPDERQPGGAG